MTSCPIISIVSELRHAHCCMSSYQSNSRSCVGTTRVGGQSSNDAIYEVATFTFVTIVRTLVPDEVALRKFYGRYGDVTKQYEVPLSLECYPPWGRRGLSREYVLRILSVSYKATKGAPLYSDSR